MTSGLPSSHLPEKPLADSNNYFRQCNYFHEEGFTALLNLEGSAADFDKWIEVLVKLVWSSF